MTNTNQATTTVSTDRLRHLEALAAVVYAFVEEARYIDAHYNQAYTDMARELRALGYQIRQDIPAE